MRLVILVSERSSCLVDILTTLVLRRESTGHLQLIALGGAIKNVWCVVICSAL